MVAVSGCDQPSSFKPATAKVAQDPVTADIDRMQAQIRIAAANKRIDELERQVAELQAAPEKLDLELLTRRVATLETMDHGDMAVLGTSPGKLTPSPNQGPRPFPRATEARQDKPQKASKLNIPELETRSRLATTDEAKAFNRTK